MTFNPSTNALTTTTFVGALTGAASGNLTLASPVNHGVLISGAANATTATTAGTSGQFLGSNGASADPTFKSFTPPTQQRLTTGTAATYTTPANVLYLRVRMVGGGGGGGGSGTSRTDGGSGGNTTFGTSLLVANGAGATSGNTIGSGGTASITAPAYGTALQGGFGSYGGLLTTTAIGNGNIIPGGAGTGTPFGGASGGGSLNTAATGGIGNTGSGGGGATYQATTTHGAGQAGLGGAAGGFVDAIVVPSAGQTFLYTVGSAGSAGGAGTNGFAGSLGGSGYIEVTEYYQ